MLRSRRIFALILAMVMLSAVLSSCTLPQVDDETTTNNTDVQQTLPDITEPDSEPGAAGTDGEPVIDIPPIVTEPAETNPPPAPTPEEIPGKLVIVSSSGYSEYTIVYPAGASAIVRYAAQELASYLNTTFPGANIKAQADGGKGKALEKEILIGKCDRSEIPTLTAGKSDYIVKVSGSKLLLCGADDSATLAAIEYFKYAFASETRAAAPNNFEYICASMPEVLTQSPEKYYYYENVYTPTLNFTYLCIPAVDYAATKLLINNVDCTSLAMWGANSVSFSGQKFAAGTYNVQLVLTDTEGDTVVHSSVFSCGDGSVMNLYSGELHAHTSESDGVGTVEQAYIYARDTAKLDFFAVTDHSDSININTYKKTHIITADKLNDPGRYVTIYGYEQTYNFSYGYYGHLNVINYDSLTSRTMKLEGFYKLMARQSNAVVMFNHPGYKWGNFMEYSLYNENIDAVLNLSEIKGASYDTEYSLALSNGWHVSPMWNEDNHSADWGSATEACGFALAPSLTRQNIMEAFAKNRTYTTSDKSLRVYYKINDQWMGSRLDNPDKLKVSIDLSTQKATGLGKIFLMGEDNIVVARIDAGKAKTYHWEFELDPLYDYYYVKIEGSNWCLTAPIWVENRDELTIESLDYSVITDNTGTDDYLMRASVRNNSKKTMTDVSVDYYITMQSGFDLTTAKPYKTVNYGNIPAEASVNISGSVKYLAASPRVTAIVTGYIDGVKYCDTTNLILSNLYITEIMPLTASEGSITDPYEYFEIYNNSDTAINLSNYSIRYYPKAGADATALANNTWKLTGTIEPFSSMVIWIKASNNNKTVSDFNKKYGTNLVQNKDIVIVTSSLSIPSANAVQLEMLYSGTVTSRIWYNWGDQVNFTTGKSVEFKYPVRFTNTSLVFTSMASPSPGKVNANQVPMTIKNSEAK